jgi:hypothetical protein
MESAFGETAYPVFAAVGKVASGTFALSFSMRQLDYLSDLFYNAQTRRNIWLPEKQFAVSI